MTDLIQQALFPVNLPFTILLAVLAGYWAFVSLGVFDLEGGGDADAEMDLSGADSDVGGGPGLVNSILHFLNIGEVPVMIVLSVFVLVMWVCGILANFFFNDGSILLGLTYLIPAFVVSVVITRYATIPFRKIFKMLHEEGAEHLPLVGRTCKVTTGEVNDRFGQAEIETAGSPVLLQVRTTDGTTLSRGDSALVIGKDPKTGTFSVVKVSNDKLEV